jgi:hypothetical protein
MFGHARMRGGGLGVADKGRGIPAGVVSERGLEGHLLPPMHGTATAEQQYCSDP